MGGGLLSVSVQMLKRPSSFKNLLHSQYIQSLVRVVVTSAKATSLLPLMTRTAGQKMPVPSIKGTCPKSVEKIQEKFLQVLLNKSKLKSNRFTHVFNESELGISNLHIKGQINMK